MVALVLDLAATNKSTEVGGGTTFSLSVGIRTNIGTCSYYENCE
jgi:hypothetical protein